MENTNYNGDGIVFSDLAEKGGEIRFFMQDTKNLINIFFYQKSNEKIINI